MARWRRKGEEGDDRWVRPVSGGTGERGAGESADRWAWGAGSEGDARCGRAGCCASGAGRGVGRARVERGALAFWAVGARAWVGSR